MKTIRGGGDGGQRPTHRDKQGRKSKRLGVEVTIGTEAVDKIIFQKKRYSTKILKNKNAIQ